MFELKDVKKPALFLNMMPIRVEVKDTNNEWVFAEYVADLWAFQDLLLTRYKDKKIRVWEYGSLMFETDEDGKILSFDRN